MKVVVAGGGRTPGVLFKHVRSRGREVEEWGGGGMSYSDNAQIVAEAATSQIKICPYDEEEQAIWFRLSEAEFAAAGIKSQKLRYANALASLPKQVLQDILDTVDVCNESDGPFYLLKELMLVQFGKSKW